MRRVKNHGRELSHDGERSHVDDQIVVAEAGSAFGKKYPIIACGAAFFHCMFHIPRRDELAFLDIHRPLAHGGGDDQIGLAAEESRNLQHIRDFRNLGDVRGFVHVGEHRNVDFIFDFFENAQSFDQTRSAKAAHRSPIGLIVGSFKDERNVERAGHALDNFCHE